MLSDEEGFRKGLDEMGEEAVRRNLSRNVWNPQKVAVAELWLADMDDARIERSQRESLTIARSAKNAAWAAAIAAIIAVPIAIVSIVIAYLGWASPHR